MTPTWRTTVSDVPTDKSDQAEKAGIEPGAIVTRINGVAVTSENWNALYDSSFAQGGEHSISWHNAIRAAGARAKVIEEFRSGGTNGQEVLVKPRNFTNLNFFDDEEGADNFQATYPDLQIISPNPYSKSRHDQADFLRKLPNTHRNFEVWRMSEAEQKTLGHVGNAKRAKPYWIGDLWSREVHYAPTTHPKGVERTKWGRRCTQRSGGTVVICDDACRRKILMNFAATMDADSDVGQLTCALTG